MKKRGQITIFLIISIVLLLAAGSLIYLVTYSTKKTIARETARTKEISSDLQPINNLIFGCLDKLSKDSLKLIGRQGGYIYKNQGGTFIDFNENDNGLFFINYENSKVSYGIYQPKFSIAPYSDIVPEYPWQFFPYNDASKSSKTFTGLFGISNLPPLNESEGPHSVRQQLISYIESNIKNCTDFGVFKDFEIKTGKHKADVEFADSDVIFDLIYHVNIKNIKTGEITNLERFNSRQKIRFKQIYSFVQSLVENDIRDINFNIDKDFFRESFSVNVLNDAFNRDDIVIVRDEKSIVDGKAYEFRFARHNRNPALFYLGIPEKRFPNLYRITQDELLNAQKLEAFDPDEDKISFIFEPGLPRILDLPKIDFKVKASDSSLEDYEIVTVVREAS